MEHVDDERVLCIKIYDTNKLDDMNTTHFTVTAWNARLRENRDVYVVSKRLEKKPSAFPSILPMPNNNNRPLFRCLTPKPTTHPKSNHRLT